MNTDEELRKQLVEIRQKRVDRAIRSLLIDDDVDTARRHLSWIETADRVVQAAAPGAEHPIYFTGIIVLVCLSLVGFAWSLRTSNNAVKLDIRADGVQFRLAENWNVANGLVVSRVEAQELSEADIPGFGGMPITEFLLACVHGRIQNLALSKGAIVELDFRPRGISLFIWNGTVTGEISISSAKMVWRDRSGHKNRHKLTGVKGLPPEFLRFQGKNSDREIPIRIDFDTSKAWKSIGLIVASLDFSREEPRSSNTWVSTVLEGKGNFLDVNQTIELDAGDWLKLEGITPVPIQLIRHGAKVSLRFEGFVDRLSAGKTDKTLRNLSPTWLEYLAKQQDVGIVWAALVLLWGLAWRFRGLL